ncbi:MAG TPA: signal peptidase I [Rhizomicrobium sp.]|nr:signal peptidase I [Rhizomicrobium sp.]
MSDDDPVKLIDELTDEPAAAPEPEAPPVPPPPAAEPPPPPPEPAKGATPVQPQGESWGETIKTIVYALLIALVIRSFLFQPFYIPSGSMEATLLVGDFLFIEKFAYGYSRNSFPYSLAPFHGRVFGAGPARGDVVVFKMPNRNSAEYMEDFIKRVIGLPGDHVQMKGGVLYLNDKAIPKVRVADYIERDPFGVVSHVPQYRETLPGGKSYLVLDRFNSDEDNTTVFVVPAGDYFMMGDNRDNSDDSRADVGYVPAENLVGRAELRFFSIDDSAIWYEPWTWPGAIRFSRMFTLID